MVVKTGNQKAYSIGDTKEVTLTGYTNEEKEMNDLTNYIEKRLKEAEKLGFKTCIIPESNKKVLKDSYKLDIIGVKNINEAMKVLFK